MTVIALNSAAIIVMLKFLSSEHLVKIFSTSILLFILGIIFSLYTLYLLKTENELLLKGLKVESLFKVYKELLNRNEEPPFNIKNNDELKFHEDSSKKKLSDKKQNTNRDYNCYLFASVGCFILGASIPAITTFFL